MSDELKASIEKLLTMTPEERMATPIYGSTLDRLLADLTSTPIEKLRENAKAVVDAYLSAVAASLPPPGVDVVCDESNNSEERLRQGYLTLDLIPTNDEGARLLGRLNGILDDEENRVQNSE